MMPTCPLPTNSHPRERGFTLIELLVVLTVIGLLAAVALPSMQSRPTALGRAKLATEIEGALRLQSGKAVRLGKVVAIDPKHAFQKSVDYSPALGAEDRILFYPDGSTNGGVISSGGRPLLSIRWLDGQTTRV